MATRQWSQEILGRKEWQSAKYLWTAVDLSTGYPQSGGASGLPVNGGFMLEDGAMGFRELTARYDSRSSELTGTRALSVTLLSFVELTTDGAANFGEFHLPSQAAIDEVERTLWLTGC
ncbi:hypothetical protein [Amycolatopsis sp. WQ 127309]|uniref:hypothetical protein n=1 Tax=Amycolatopsis sp. WQ 127309 TaxID=2932773 RepID=UPI001FF1D73A|nr:hypothetical protein [Amycolatopsis sp. WQ 127309]UOZ09385.1 hypothetical protein MUY22_14380 [Amycolatopsis sp. WQ 127309]